MRDCIQCSAVFSVAWLRLALLLQILNNYLLYYYYYFLIEPEIAAALPTTVQLMELLYAPWRCKKRQLAAANTKKRIWVHEMNKTRNDASVFNKFNQLKDQHTGVPKDQSRPVSLCVGTQLHAFRRCV